MNDPREPQGSSLRETLERIEKRMDTLPTARRLPVWVQVALLGAGLTLATGCTDKSQGTTSPTGERAPMQEDASPEPAITSPPGMEAEMEAEAEGKVVVMTANGVYGAPPMRTVDITMLRVPRGTVVSKTPGAKPEQSYGFKSVKYNYFMPSRITAGAKTMFADLREAINTCLITALQKPALDATGFSMELNFDKGFLKIVKIFNDKELPAELRSCIQAAADVARSSQPKELPKDQGEFTGSLSVDVSW
ncbi:MAG: hypothetical protein CVU59_05885 [Deltaproteobacteria bacterium HGW-Deltaproteobacteria-17]|nr:MAG: hypothetical protein CVU59_05885 [Deltaproteobacteria bacterium HGW-Deltaproteobacteria-17]